MKHDHTFAEPQNLAPVYFVSPKAWWFHTSDFFIFYYILSAIIFIIALVVILFSGGTPQKNSQQLQSENQPLTGISASIEPEAEEPIEAPSPDQAALLKSAQEQPTYALQMEAYRQLKDNQTLSNSQQNEVAALLLKTEAEFARWEKDLAAAKRYMEQEYYSSAIKALKPFLEAGSVLGNLLTEAQEVYVKAHTKKIDYFLLKGQITQAKKALQEAEQAKLSADHLSGYADKIQSLELAGR